MDNKKLTKAAAGTAKAEEKEEKEQTATGLGKFKDVDALIEAYNNLEAEFTRRSQRLKELESANKEQAEPAEDADAQTPEDEGVEGDDATSEEAPSQGQEVFYKSQLVEEALKSDEVKKAVIGEYLASAVKNRGVQLISGGVNVSAQRQAPKNLKEAGKLAQEYLTRH